MWRPIFYIVFICANYYIYSMVNEFKKQPECGCATGWQPENLLLLSQLAMLLGIINLLLPLNKSLYKIPLVSNLFSIGLLCVVFIQMFTLSRFVRALNNRDDCNESKCKPGQYQPIVNSISTWSLSTVGLLSLGITICLLYL